MLYRNWYYVEWALPDYYLQDSWIIKDKLISNMKWKIILHRQNSRLTIQTTALASQVLQELFQQVDYFVIAYVKVIILSTAWTVHIYTKFWEMENSSQVAQFRHIAKLWGNWSSQLIAMEISGTEENLKNKKESRHKTY